MKKISALNGLMVAFIGLSLGTISCKKEGCTDPLATNYDNKANHDNGTCIYGPGTGPTTNFGGNITVPTTLEAGNYKVCDDVYVSAALTLKPGVTLNFCAGVKMYIEASGSMNAVGTAALPITLRGEVSTSGYWAGLGIESNNPLNVFEFVTIKDGGSYWAFEESTLHLNDDARLTMRNSTVSNSAGNGMYVLAGATLPSFSGNTFSSNALAGLNITSKQIGSLDAASNYNSANGEAVIYVRQADVTTAQTWPATNAPLLLNGYTNVSSALTINPGATLYMGPGAELTIEASGSISAIGTASSPIQIQGQFSSAGYGAGVSVESNNPANKFNYVNMAHLGSYWAMEYSSLFVGGRLEIDNSSITNSNSWAIYVDGSSTLISNGATQVAAAGVMVTNTLTGNGAGADADCIGGGCTVFFE